MAYVIREKQDLTYLKWAHARTSSGTTGTFLKSESKASISGKKIYYKMSNFDREIGIVGHECVNEIIIDRLLNILGVAHLDYKLISHVIRNKILQKNLKVDSGGYSISFDCNIVISANILRNSHYSEPLSASDFFSYVKNGLVSSSGVCDILGCSRQNVSYLVKEGKLKPILDDCKEKIFTLGSVWSIE